MILMVADRASWHTTNKLKIPDNICFVFIPPATPKMNPIEQVWKYIRARGLKNRLFKTLNDLVDKLCDVVCSLTKKEISSITLREYIKCEILN